MQNMMMMGMVVVMGVRMKPFITFGARSRLVYGYIARLGRRLVQMMHKVLLAINFATLTFTGNVQIFVVLIHVSHIRSPEIWPAVTWFMAWPTRTLPHTWPLAPPFRPRGW